jgi:hypothetical protein
LRRHPSVLAATIVLLVLLTAGSLLATWLIRLEQDKTQLAYEHEKEQFRIARRYIDEMIQLAEEELADKPHVEGLRKRLLESAMAYYQEFVEQRRDDPEAQQELAATQARVRKIFDDLSVLQGAVQLFLLKNEKVLDDLRPTSAQRERLAEVSRRLDQQKDEDIREFVRLSPEERRKGFIALARVNEAAVQDILTREQKERLRQIALQNQGPAAFHDADVAAELQLTSEQKEKIRAIEGEAFPIMFDHMHPRGSPGKPPKPPEEKKKEATSQVINMVLTPEQAQRWRELRGELFKGSISVCPPPGSFGQPPPGGPHGRPGGPGGPRR